MVGTTEEQRPFTQVPSVLVVDDDADVREIVSEVIEDEGLSVVQASNAAEALEKLKKREGRVDLVVTDIRMPGMDGVELAAKIDERWPGTRVLFMTGYAGELLTRRRPLDSSIQLLRKPFTLTDLTQRVHDLLGEHVSLH